MTLIAFLIIFPLVIAALLLLVKGDWPRNIIVGISAAVIAVASILLAVQYLGTAHRLFEFSSVIVDYVGTAISIAIAAVIISFILVVPSIRIRADTVNYIKSLTA